MQSFQMSARQFTLVVIDAMLINLALYVTLILRFEGRIPPEVLRAFIQLSPLFTVITLTFFAGFRLYSRILQYASIGEMITIHKATAASTATFVLIIYLFQLPGLPRSVYVGSWIIINGLVGASRIGWRLYKERFMRTVQADLNRTLIFGAGDAGAILYREIRNNPKLKMYVCGFIDDNQTKHRKMLYGVPVLGGRGQIPRLVHELRIDEIIIAMPSISGETIRGVVDICRGTGARVRILPGIYQSTRGGLLANLRKVQMEDLLRRATVKTDLQEIAGYIGSKTVMVTGAGGSIGSELCRQVLSLEPARLIMVDNCENNLFDIEIEMKEQMTGTVICPELHDVKHLHKMEDLFKTYRPQVVFHAAAYKHVPMMERHADEALGNNVIGTRNMAILADRYGVKTFIQVSTDKAVNPTSVMGASKRMAELVVKDINRGSQTKFAAVRFGNVLGSRGSVIPTFIKQIEAGGPVTVTHPEMRRYFMTIPEAVQLIIQAGSMAAGGEIFVLDMGEMVKIDDLARDLIHLSGREPGKDIEITYSGIRPGEKLYEELFTAREGMIATKHQRIFISKKALDENYINIGETIARLYRTGLITSSEVIDLIGELIPEYQGSQDKADDKAAEISQINQGDGSVG